MATSSERNPSNTSRPSSISSKLLEQVRAQKPDAWDRFVRLFSPLIYRWCRRSGVPAVDAADVLQEVLYAVMLHIKDFHRDRPNDSFSGWLATITRNKIHDHYRRGQGEAKARGGSTAQRQITEIPQVLERSQSSILPDRNTKAWLSRQVLDLVRAEFESRTWEAFLQTAIQKLPPPVVAENLQMSVPAVYMAKSRVLRRLREVYGELP